jgi:predicted phage terminase large subunit-like protein
MEFEKTNRCYSSLRRQDMPTERVARVQREQESVPRWYTEEEWEEEPTKPPELNLQWVELTQQDRREEESELLWPERFSRRHVDEDLKPALRSWGGTYAEAGQLQQRPAPRGGGMFQRDDFQYLDHLPTEGRWVRGYDLANSTERRSPWTVGVKMGVVDGRVIVADVRRYRAGPGEVEQRIHATAEADGRGVTIDIPQDPGQAGKSQKTALARMLHGFVVRSSPESGSKEDRARPLAAQAELRNLYLLRAPWNDAFVSEACLFPNGEFKDQIDAATRAYARLVGRRPPSTPAAPQIIGG